MNNYHKSFYNYLILRDHLSENTAKSYLFDVKCFDDFLEIKKYDYKDVNKEIIREFLSYRLNYKTYTGKKETSRTLNRRICGLRKYFDYHFSISQSLISSHLWNSLFLDTFHQSSMD